MRPDSPVSPALASLRRQWLFTAATWLAILLAGTWWLLRRWPFAGRWALLAALLLGYNLVQFWRALPLNVREPAGDLLPRLGPGNQLSLVRGLAISLLAGFLFSPWPQGGLAWIPVLLYTIADVADYFDGFLARRSGMATSLGARLDVVFDGQGLLIVTLLAVWYGQLPWWYLLIGLARYVVLLGLWWRRRGGRPVYELPVSLHRRLFAGFQMGFMSAVLWPIVPATAATVAGTIFALATALGFLRDWLVASGRLDPDAPAYRSGQRWVVRAATRWLPPVLRLGVLVSMVGLYGRLADPVAPPAWVALFRLWRLPGPELLALAAGLGGILFTGTLFVGLMARSSGLLLLFPIGFYGVTAGWDGLAIMALSCVITVMLLGSGPYSLWRPEERYLLLRLGGPEPA